MAKARVLFVDDEPGIRATLPAVLGMHGFHVTTAGTVPEALDLINKQEFDVLLSDLNIGEPGDGFTVVSAMRRVQPTAVTIIITGFPAFETALEAIRSQVDDYVVKPADPQALVRTIEHALSEAHVHPHRPMPTKRVWQVIDESRDVIVSEWVAAVEAMPEVASVPLSRRERADHVPQVLDELVRMLRAKQGPEASPEALEGATKHGLVRRRQHYSIPMLLEEGRVLRRVVCEVVQQNLLAIEISSLISDMMAVQDNLGFQINESVRAYLRAEGAPRDRVA